MGPGEETGFLHAADKAAWGDADLSGQEYHFDGAFGAVELKNLPVGGGDEAIGGVRSASGFWLV